MIFRKICLIYQRIVLIKRIGWKREKLYRMNSIVTKLAILSIEDGLCLNYKIYDELSRSPVYFNQMAEKNLGTYLN